MILMNQSRDTPTQVQHPLIDGILIKTPSFDPRLLVDIELRKKIIQNINKKVFVK